LQDDLRRTLNIDLPIVEWGAEEGIDEVAIRDRVMAEGDRIMAVKAANFGPDLLRFIEKSVLIQTLDAVWKEHLHALDHLRQGIGLRAYGQRDPLNEYKSEAFALFNAMLDELKERVTGLLARVELGEDPPPAPAFDPASGHYEENHPAPDGMFGDTSAVEMAPISYAGERPSAQAVDINDISTWRNVGRNSACPCGSGRKYKHCHGKLN